MNSVKEKMKRQSIEIKKDVSLLVDSITNIIRSTIEQDLPQPNLHKAKVYAYSINKEIYVFEFWAKDEQVYEINKIIHSIYDLEALNVQDAHTPSNIVPFKTTIGN